MATTGILNGHYRDTSWLLYTEILYGHYRDTSWPLQRYFMATTEIPCDYYQVETWLGHDYHSVTGIILFHNVVA
jgi:hypothetical protein